MSRDEGLHRLNSRLKESGKCAIAFSGGVDSTFLLAAAVRILGSENVAAITVIPPYVARWEVKEAGELAAQLGVRHYQIESDMIESVKTNPPDRCYLCKTALFKSMKDLAGESGLGALFDGSNADDLGDYRPGMRALRELGIKSPLLESGLGKKDIRDISREWNLPTWDKPPYACLLTRIPHDVDVDFPMLKQIEQSEIAMIEAGFPFVRVRHHNDMARIEIPNEDFERFVNSGQYGIICRKLQAFGYRFVTLDLQGYKMGNMNSAGTDNG